MTRGQYLALCLIGGAAITALLEVWRLKREIRRCCGERERGVYRVRA